MAGKFNVSTCPRIFPETQNRLLILTIFCMFDRQKKKKKNVSVILLCTYFSTVRRPVYTERIRFDSLSSSLQTTTVSKLLLIDKRVT